ncbi:hypothetical protein SAMN05660841_01789 [Sphingobacterium nematocida]|uniref:Bacteriophage CI repressor helix-turn-helix domain-containing protein n=1 Tax=Sphingobacterium nematocida TaxID=1513896 RepID=A0A1T5D6R6_9SPHI|nr:hypothetical protein [Sphingobacterium nematocida]SKB67432.1 hypothetical protein SAMN05660841_01789 [Sphingobacterium nematocida]
MDNLSLTIKERILLIAGHAKLSKIEFFKDLGLSYANFKGEQKKSGLSSDALLKVLSKYPELSPSWLLLGEGEMLKPTAAPTPVTVEKNPSAPKGYVAPLSDSELQFALYDAFKELSALIEEQSLHLRQLAKRVEELEKKGKDSKKKKKKK